jgi:hypothetical protein
MASSLPADGGEYPVWIQLQTEREDRPIQSPYDMSIRLSTSDDSVIFPVNSPTIMRGESLVMATIKTTSKAGAAEITAFSDGVNFGAAKLNTVSQSLLEPSILAIHAGSGKFIPNPGFPGKIYVQLLNSENVPAATKTHLTVFLSSSEPRIGTVPFQVTVPAGSSGILADFTPTFEAGTTKLTASANGFTPSQVEVKTAGLSGTRLVVEVAPKADIPAPFGYYSFFTVQIQDSSGIPVRAEKPLTVTLSSSNTNVIETIGHITIPTGSSYVMESVKSKGTVGSATLSASAQGLETGALSITTRSENWADPDDQKLITVSALPSTVASDSAESSNIIVQVTDSQGRPFSFQSHHYTGMNMYSSDPAFVLESPFLKPEATFAVGAVKAQFDGISAVSVSKGGYSPGSTAVEARGLSPTGVEISQLHKVVLANNAASTSVLVSTVDSKGNPVPARKDVFISLSSSQQDVATVEVAEVIPKGQAYALVEVTAVKAGTTTLTASSQGLAGSSLELKPVGSTGDSLSLKLGIKAPSKMLADGRSYNSVFVQLQNSAGNPVPAKSDIVVNLSSSSTRTASVQNNVTIKSGSTYAAASVTPTSTPGEFALSASSTGYTTVSTKIETSAAPLTIVRAFELPRTAPFEGMRVAVDVVAAGLPVADALVKISGIAAETVETSTDANGHAEGMYIPTQPGRNSIDVTVSKAGYSLTKVSYPITLDQTVTLLVSAQTEAGKQIAVQAKMGASSFKTVSVKAGVPTGLENVKFGTYITEVPTQFTSSGARYEFVSWSDGVTQNRRADNVIYDTGLTAIYAAEYRLSATTELGIVTGNGYYPEGEVANLSISQTRFDGFPVDKSFAGWTGDVSIASANAGILMDGPKNVTAKWETSYLKLMALIGAAAAGGVVSYFKVIKPKRESVQKARAPDLDWYKK